MEHDVTIGLEKVLGPPTMGKVRNTYQIPHNADQLLMVSTARVSTHNVSHLSSFPGKGEILNALPIYWATRVFPDVKTHLVAYGRRIYDGLPKKASYHPRLHYSAVRVHRRRVTGREFIYRRFSAGSFQKGYDEGWKGYCGKDPYGYNFDPPPQLMQRFKNPLFTPTRKSKNDEPLQHTEVERFHPKETALGHDLFLRGERHLKARGITLVDMKIEASGDMLVDEWLDGDCCRMVWSDLIRQGVEPPWLDKELVRQDAIRQWAGGKKVPLTFSPELIKKAMDAYHQAFEVITGMTLSQFQKDYLD